MPLWACGATPCGESCQSDSVLSWSEGMTGLGDGQTEAEGIPSRGGRGDALFRRMLPYVT